MCRLVPGELNTTEWSVDNFNRTRWRSNRMIRSQISNLDLLRFKAGVVCWGCDLRSKANFECEFFYSRSLEFEASYLSFKFIIRQTNSQILLLLRDHAATCNSAYNGSNLSVDNLWNLWNYLRLESDFNFEIQRLLRQRLQLNWETNGSHPQSARLLGRWPIWFVNDRSN